MSGVQMDQLAVVSNRMLCRSIKTSIEDHRCVSTAQEGLLLRTLPVPSQSQQIHAFAMHKWVTSGNLMQMHFEAT